ncbi:hypothetical protein TNCV_2058791 [Trichonephila clavipes]|nr:hypothetical protein TNCV_2058791 [Trichonephila clavipes]
MTPELAHPFPSFHTTPSPRLFNVHQPPVWWRVFSGTGSQIPDMLDTISCPFGDHGLLLKKIHSLKIQFPREWHHSKRKCRWVGVKGSTRNGRRDPKCPSARRLRMIREDRLP